jgi:hypothetical protein
MAFTGVFEKLKKVYDEVLEGRKTSSSELYSILIGLNRHLMQIRTWCLENKGNEFEQLCLEIESFTLSLFKTLLAFIFNKAILDNVQIENDELGSSLQKMLGTATNLLTVLSKTIIINDRDVLCKVIKAFQKGNTIIPSGYVTFMPLSEALYLLILGFVKILEIF